MVGRLIENEKIRSTEKHPGKGSTLNLTSRQMIDNQFGIINAKLR